MRFKVDDLFNISFAIAKDKLWNNTNSVDRLNVLMLILVNTIILILEGLEYVWENKFMKLLMF